MKIKAPFHVGNTFTADVARHKNGAVDAPRDKSARRALRRLLSGNVPSSYEIFTGNSHERKRHERDKRRWRRFVAVWGDIGSNYATLTGFARKAP